MSLQAKVGAFTVVGLMILIGMIYSLGDIKLGAEKQYDISVNFKQAIGLKPNADVCMAGFKVGKVKNIVLEVDHVRVDMGINEGYKIPRGSNFSITSDGIMGEQFVNITAPANGDLSDFYKEGEVISGNEAPTVEDVIVGVNKTMDKVQDLLNSMNLLIGDENFRNDIHDMTTNMKQVTANLDKLTATLSQMALDNQGNIQQMTHNLSMLTASLMRSADSVEQMVAAFNGDGETAENLKQAIRNLTSTSQRIEKMAASVEGVVTDPQVADDLKATIHNARNVSERANSMMKTVESIEVKPGFEAMYSGKSYEDNKNWQAGADVTVSMGEETDNKYLRLGVKGIGDGNRVDALAGMRSGSLGGHAGVIESKAGVGLDAYLGDKVTLSVDGYDPNDFRLKSRLSYEFAPDTYVFTQVNDINHSDKRTAYVGLRREF